MSIRSTKAKVENRGDLLMPLLFSLAAAFRPRSSSREIQRR